MKASTDNTEVNEHVCVSCDGHKFEFHITLKCHKIFIYSEHMSLCENMTLTSDIFNVLTVVMGFASIHEGNSAIEFAFWIHWRMQRFHRHRPLCWEV